MTGTAVTFGTLDWAIVALYFVANTAICIWCAMQKEKNTADYFLASRSAGWFLIGSSIFASNIGAEHLIGLAGSGAGSGMAFAHWELHSYLVLVLGWIFAPFYLRAEYLHHAGIPRAALHARRRARCSRASFSRATSSPRHRSPSSRARSRSRPSWVTRPSTCRCSARRISSGSPARFLVIITGVFVVLGGMKSVLYTEAMHVPVLLAGSAVLLFVGLARNRRHGCAEGREPGHVSPLAAAVDHARDARLSRIPVRHQRHAVARRAAVLTHHRALVLVHRPIHRAARAHRRAGSRKRGAARSSPAI